MPLKKSGSKVFLLLASLAKEELADFRAFLDIPRVNHSELLLALYDYCIRFHPGFPEEQVSKEAVHRALFAGSGFVEKRIRNLFSDLSLRVMDYLSWTAFSAEQDLQKALLVKEFRKRGLDSLAQREAHHYLAQTLESRDLSRDQLFVRMQIQELLFEDEDLGLKYLAGAQDDLDRFFTLSKLRLSTILVSRRGFLYETYKIRFLDQLGSEVSKEELTALDQLYLDILGLLNQGFQPDVYERVQGVFFDLAPRLAYEDRRVLFQTLVNIAVRLITEKGSSFNRPLWELYKRGLKTQVVFSEKGELSDITFTNILVNSSSIQEFKWAEAFILKYELRLPADIRQNAVALGKAFLYYHQGVFGRVIELLRDVKYSSVSYALRGRSLLLRTYFDMASGNPMVFSPEFYSHLDAFQRYLNRMKDLAPNRKKAYLKFLSFAKSLALIASGDRPASRLPAIENEIRQSDEVIAKEWLLNKAGEIKKLRG